MPDQELIPLAEQPARKKKRRLPGQALVEYVLIIALVVISLVAILAVVGPAMGNVFSNQVYNLIGATALPYKTLSSDDFWKYVTAVASYTPIRTPFKTFTPSGVQSSTPVINPTNTYVNSPTATGTVTPTGTVGPSPTPTDSQMTVPYADGADNLTLWYAGGEELAMQNAWAALPWEAKWSASYSTPLSVPAPDTTLDYTGDIRFNYNNAGRPGSIPAQSFYVSYKNKNTVDKVPFEGRVYNFTLTVGPDDAAEFYIDSGRVALVPETVPTNPEVKTYRGTYQTPGTDTNVPPRSYHDIEVRYWAGPGTTYTHSLQLVFNSLANIRPDPDTTKGCAWSQQSTFNKTAPFAFQDKFNLYVPGSLCNMRLRGYFDIPGTNPFLSFWNQYDLKAGVKAEVGIREYTWSGVGGPDWSWHEVHSNLTNLNFVKEFMNLSSFEGKNFAGKRVEIAFRVWSTSTYDVAADGWYIDDIAIGQDTLKVFGIPAVDRVGVSASPSTFTWIPECDWARTTDSDQGTDGYSYSDSPGAANYGANTDCSLVTEGVLDLSLYGGANPKEPELDFWTKGDLANSTTFSVEYLPIADRGNPGAWIPLTPRGSANPFIAQGLASFGWTNYAVDLLSLSGPGKQYFFRFRLKAGATTAAGVNVDTIQFRERPSLLKALPYFEPFNSNVDWSFGGNWATASSPLSSLRRSPSNALTDSPAGNSTPNSGGISNVAKLVPQIDLTNAFSPRMEFWAWWDAAPGTSLFLDTMDETDAPNSYPRIAWQQDGGGLPGTNRAWQRIVVDLKSVAGYDYSNHKLQFRFRLTSLPGFTGDGIYVDDIHIWNDVSPYLTSANPFYLNMENEIADATFLTNSTSNFYAGGEWKLSTADKRSGAKSWTASPASVYPTPGDSTLELIPILDLNGVVDPILTFWTKHDINTQHYLVAEARRIADTSWTQLNWVSRTGETPINQRQGRNGAWTRNLADLKAIFGNQKILIRFRLVAFNNITGTTMTGNWSLDDIYIGPRNQLNEFAPIIEDFTKGGGGATDLPRWTLEGDWQAVDQFTPWKYELPPGMTATSYDYGDGPNSQWNSDYYHFPAGVNPTSGASVCPADVGNQIRQPIIEGTGSFSIGTGSSNAFSWTGGSATATGTAYTGSLYRTGAIGNGFTIQAASSPNRRTLKAYVRVENVGASGVQMTPTLSDGTPGVPVSDTITGNGEYMYTFTNYSTTTPDQFINIKFVTLDAGTRIHLRAVTVDIPGTLQGSTLNWTRAPATGTVILTTQGTGDWTVYGADVTGVPVRKGDCVKSFLYQQSNVVDRKWTDAAPPSTLADWTTNAGDNRNYFVSFKRQIAFSAGTYRFWMTANDGFNLYINGTLRTPKATISQPNLSSTSLTPNTDQTVPNAAPNYFYEESLAASTAIVEIQYYQKANDDAVIRMRMSSNLTIASNGTILAGNQTLHNNAGGDYALGQRVSTYLGVRGWVDSGAISPVHGGIRVNAGQNVRITYYSRYTIGGINSGSADGFGVFYQVLSASSGTPVDLSDGSNWFPVGYNASSTPVRRQARSADGELTYSGGVPVYVSVPFIYNKGTVTDPINDYQNWDLHYIDFPARAFSYTLNLKFEIDSRVNNIAGTGADGWYIDDLNVITY